VPPPHREDRPDRKPRSRDWLQRAAHPRPSRLEEYLLDRTPDTLPRPPEPFRRLVDLPRVNAWPGREYWLCRCEGFRVDSQRGRLGLVDGLQFGTRVDLPDVLEVRGGFFGKRVLLIPVRQVQEIDGEAERIVVRDERPPPRHLYTDVLERLHAARGRPSA
jgi:hypothetical protein